MTTVQKILILFAFIPAMPLVHSKQALWGQRVFPDDFQWLSSWKKGDLKDIEDNAEAKKYKICETTECKKVAEEFLSSMNKSMDPCEDFYEFSCGGWRVNDPIPPSSPSWSRVMIFEDTVRHRIKNVLETEPDSSDILPVRQAKKWYRSCMNSETLERRGIKPIESILMQAGGWPISMDEEEWDAEEYTWQKVEREYARITGSYVFYKIAARSPSGDSEYGEINIGAPSIPLSEQLPLMYRNYSGNDYATYVHFVERVVDLFVQHNRADVSKEKIRKEVEEMVEFEKEIYKLKDKKREHKEMTFEEFIEWYETNVTEVSEDSTARIDWKTVIQGLFDMVNINVHPSSEFFVRDIAYFKGIGELLRITSSRTIVNYIHWKFIGDMLTYTTELLRDEIFALVKEEYGVKERRPRWTECVIEMKMTDAAAYAFVTKFFTESTATAALKMIKRIQYELEEQIDKSNWLDPESKKLTKDKLNSMKIFIGYPDWYKNNTAVLNRYKGLTIGADYFDNCLSYIRYENKLHLKYYAMAREMKEEPWDIDPITVNALYGISDNTINIPAADFQSPLFTPGLPDNVNYGIAGLVIGHEMSHGFDDDGITVDKDGNDTQLSKDMLKAYYQRADCFLDQFEGYYGETKASGTEVTTSDDEKRESSKGLRTRGENIADTTGIQAVFQAYQKLNKPGGDSRLPGLEEFTDDQLFFLSFAAMWCEIGTPEFEKKNEKSKDSHSPSRYRVIGAVSNTKGFAKTFNCPKGSSMNPINKCSIWEKPGAILEAEQGSNKRNNHRWGGHWRY